MYRWILWPSGGSKCFYNIEFVALCYLIFFLKDGESCSEDRECLINQCLGNICMLPVGVSNFIKMFYIFYLTYYSRLEAPATQVHNVKETLFAVAALVSYCVMWVIISLAFFLSSNAIIYTTKPGQSCSAPNMLCGGGQLCSSGRCSGRNNGSRCQTRYQCNSRSCRGSFSNSRCSSMPLRVNNFPPHNHRRCEGNCYRDNNCIGSLSCFRTNGRTSVPGCDDDRIWSNRNRGFCIERL